MVQPVPWYSGIGWTVEYGSPQVEQWAPRRQSHGTVG